MMHVAPWEKIYSACGNGPCLSVWQDGEDESVVVMGPELAHEARPEPGPGETVVRIPRFVLLEAARRLLEAGG